MELAGGRPASGEQSCVPEPENFASEVEQQSCILHGPSLCRDMNGVMPKA